MTRRALAILLHVACCLAIMSAVARTQTHYYYCEAMGLLATDPCQALDSKSGPSEVRETQSDCCRAIDIPAVPSGASSDAVTIAASPFVAVLPAVVSPRSSTDFARFATMSARLRAPPKLASERCSELMVFLT